MLWNTVGNFSYLIVQWFLTYLTTRLAGYTAAGIFSLATSVCGTFYSIAQYTMRSYQVSDIKSRYSDADYLVSRVLTSAFATSACLLLVSARGYSLEVSLCIMVYMLFKVTEAFSDVCQGFLQKAMRMDYIGKAYLIKSGIELLVFSAALKLSGNLTIAIIALAVSSASVLLTYERSVTAIFFVRGSAILRQVLSLLRDCFPLAVFGLMLTAIGQLPRFYLEAQLGTEMLGYYATVAIPITVIQVAANYIFVPLTTPMALYYEQGKFDAFVRLFVKVSLIVAAIALLALAAYALFGEQFLLLLFGKSILPYVGLGSPLVICGILTAYVWFISNTLTVLRRLKTLVLLCVPCLLSEVLLHAGLIERFGPNGASYLLIIALILFLLGGCAVLYSSFRRNNN